MFTPKLNTSRAGHLAARGNKDRRSLGIFTPPVKSPFTPSRNAQQSFNQSLQTSLIQPESAQHKLEPHESVLPILVTEAITSVQRDSDVSIRIDPCGWAWLVVGRKLLIWRYKSSQFSKLAVCKELILPASEVKHSSELVAVLPHPRDQQTVACVAASAEGTVRYWSNVAHDASFVEINAGLQGQEAAKIVALQSFHCILATTTSNLHLLIPKAGQNLLQIKPMQLPQGLLSGVGRRMSSFFFGSNNTQQMQAEFRGLISGEIMEDDSSSVYLLAGKMLQKWSVQDHYEKFCYQFDVEQQMKENMSVSIWGQDADKLQGLQVWLLDMQLVRDGVVVLGAGVNKEVGPAVHYVLGTLHTAGHTSPQSFLSFTISKYNAVYQKDDREGALKLRLLLPNPDSSSVFLHDSRSIIVLSVSNSDTPYDRVDFQSPGDQILGAGICDNTALFFSHTHGLLFLKNVQQVFSMNESIAALSESFVGKSELTMGHISTNQIQEMSMSENKTAQLKAAFLHHCRGNSQEAESIVEELFPTGIPTTGLDSLVVCLSEDLIDVKPSNDPRWAEATPDASTSASLFLHHQLEDKLKAHEYYIRFLKNIGLWNRLNAIRIRDSPIATRLLLCEHEEKIVAAMALRNMHVMHGALVDKAIKKVLESRHEKPGGSGLTAQDLFYRLVSKVDEIIESFMQIEEEQITSNPSPKEIVSIVTTVNSIIVSMLQEAWQHRQNNASMFEAPHNAPSDPEFIPWTSSTGPMGMRALLIQQHTGTVQYALTVTQDNEDTNRLYQLLSQLTDIILEGYSAQLDSLRHIQGGDGPRYREVLTKYETDRHNLIKVFMKDGQYERAASLAEKYCDFDLLVEMCEETDNPDRMQRYINMFHNKGFSDFVFRWYVKKGKHGKLLTSSLSAHPQLSHFLHSEDNAFISWVHDINAYNFIRAQETLYSQALRETNYCGKKKTLLSLSKLCALAADDTPADRIEAIDSELDMIMNQEMLPEKVLQSVNMDAKNMKVLNPEELIELYISDENIGANEYDFKKALDLLHCVNKNDPDEIRQILLHIWCKAILRDNWTNIDANEPLESCRDTVFFKTVELTCTTGGDLKDVLPPADALLHCSELGDLKDNPSFQYLIKAGYEKIARFLSA